MERHIKHEFSTFKSDGMKSKHLHSLHEFFKTTFNEMLECFNESCPGTVGNLFCLSNVVLREKFEINDQADADSRIQNL